MNVSYKHSYSNKPFKIVLSLLIASGIINIGFIISTILLQTVYKYSSIKDLYYKTDKGYY